MSQKRQLNIILAGNERRDLQALKAEIQHQFGDEVVCIDSTDSIEVTDLINKYRAKAISSPS